MQKHIKTFIFMPDSNLKLFNISTEKTLLMGWELTLPYII